MDKKKLEEDINLLYEELSKEEIYVRHDVKYSNLIDREKQSDDWQKKYTKITSKILNYYKGRKGEGLVCVWGGKNFLEQSISALFIIKSYRMNLTHFSIIWSIIQK